MLHLKVSQVSAHDLLPLTQTIWQ